MTSGFVRGTRQLERFVNVEASAKDCRRNFIIIIITIIRSNVILFHLEKPPLMTLWSEIRYYYLDILSPAPHNPKRISSFCQKTSRRLAKAKQKKEEEELFPRNFRLRDTATLLRKAVFRLHNDSRCHVPVGLWFGDVVRATTPLINSTERRRRAGTTRSRPPSRLISLQAKETQSKYDRKNETTTTTCHNLLQE